jgi:hypothetical protein
VTLCDFWCQYVFWAGQPKTAGRRHAHPLINTRRRAGAYGRGGAGESKSRIWCRMVASLLLFNVCELSTIRMVSDMLQKAVVGGQKRPVSCDCDFHRYGLGSGR